jgi:hypothetical protein
MTPQQIESMVRDEYNKSNKTTAHKVAISIGSGNASHEFDLYERSKVVGGISTSPWFNKSGSNNTGGQDRASTELLWLTLWQGSEKRVHILTNKEMACRLFKRFLGAHFPHRVEIHHFDINTKTFTLVGTL